MATLLQINSSLFGENGQSTRLADEFASAWRAANPGGKVMVRDLGNAPVPHLTRERFEAFLAKPQERSVEQRIIVAYSDMLIDELRSADLIALGLPLYNFGLPSTLKAYFDHIARAGVSFRYTEHGLEGLITGKKAYIFAARGGLYQGTPRDTQSPYIRDFLRFIGIDDVQFIHAEGLALGEAKDEALARARVAVAKAAAQACRPAREPVAAA